MSWTTGVNDATKTMLSTNADPSDEMRMTSGIMPFGPPFTCWVSVLARFFVIPLWLSEADMAKRSMKNRSVHHSTSCST